MIKNATKYVRTCAVNIKQAFTFIQCLCLDIKARTGQRKKKDHSHLFPVVQTSQRSWIFLGLCTYTRRRFHNYSVRARARSPPGPCCHLNLICVVTSLKTIDNCRRPLSCLCWRRWKCAADWRQRHKKCVRPSPSSQPCKTTLGQTYSGSAHYILSCVAFWLT